MVAKREKERARHDADAQSSCTLRLCPKFNVKKYLHQLQQKLPRVPPIPVRDLKSLHKAQDYTGIIRLIKRAMNIEEVTFLVLWVPEGAANKGKQKDAPACVEMPPDMPFYGTRAFKELTIKIFFRRSFFEQAYDEAAIAVAHELSHIVLDSLGHPLRRCEKAVDLTAMLLGFRRLYRSACYKEHSSGDSIWIQTLGYLSRQEAQLADQILAHDHWRSKLKALPLRRALMIGAILFLMVSVAALFGPWFHSKWQLHQTLLAEQIAFQERLPMRRDADTILVGVRVRFTAWTYLYNVTIPKSNFDQPALEKIFRRDVCSGYRKARINDGVSYNYEFRDTANVIFGRFEIASCP